MQNTLKTIHNLFRLSFVFNPCSPAKAPNLADLCNPISRQTIELESYPKPSTDSASLEVKIEKKNVFRFRWGVSGGGVTKRACFGNFGYLGRPWAPTH